MKQNTTQSLQNDHVSESNIHSYMDGTLSAQQTWELERHLAGCIDCERVVKEMRGALDLIHNLERNDTPDFFMAELHSKLDEIDAARAPRTFASQIESALISLRSILRTHPVQAFGMSVAVGAVLLFSTLAHPTIDVKLNPASPTKKVPSHVVVEQLLMHAAENPLDDPSADQLAMHSTTTNEGAAIP